MCDAKRHINNQEMQKSQLTLALNLTGLEISFPCPSCKTYKVYFLFSVVFWSILVHRAHLVPRMKIGPVTGLLYLLPINDKKDGSVRQGYQISK